MARKVFFSFHFERDCWRAGQIRNSGLTKTDINTAGFIDDAVWEEVKKKGDKAIKDWINNQLFGTTVTVVLVGAETSNRDYVKYELKQSWERGNGIFGIYINNVKDAKGNTDTKGDVAFGDIFTRDNDNKKYFYERFNIYDWVNDDGYKNLGAWVEAAAKQAGK